MKPLINFLIALLLATTSGQAQSLRQVPQRFAYVQPIGLAFGIGQVGLEFVLGRTTSIEVGGVGVYSEEDGIKLFGGGPGIGIRKYFGQGEAAGLVIGGRTDMVLLWGDNFDAERRFLGVGGLGDRSNELYLGLGVLLGYRWVAASGFFAEPLVSYEFLAGPDVIVPGSQDVLDKIGPSVGIAFGWAW